MLPVPRRKQISNGCLWWVLYLVSGSSGFSNIDAGSKWHDTNAASEDRDTSLPTPELFLEAGIQRRRHILQLTVQATVGSLLPPSCFARNLPLSTGAAESKTGTVSTLIPIVRLRQFLETLQAQIEDNKTQIPKLPSSSVVPRDELSFKRILDEYSDPVSYKQRFLDQNAFLVYYTKGFDGPGRPSIEDDLPVKQTLQYGARNDAWVAWDDFLVEWHFASKTSSAEKVEREELLLPLKRTLQAIDAYLSLAPPEDLKNARQQIP